MKKFIFLFAICFLFLSCSEKVQTISEHKESFGKSIEFYKNDKNEKTEYLIVIPDSYFEVKPTLRIDHYTDGVSDKSEIIENVEIGNITRVNGEIKSIVINGTKYVNK